MYKRQIEYSVVPGAGKFEGRSFLIASELLGSYAKDLGYEGDNPAEDAAAAVTARYTGSQLEHCLLYTSNLLNDNEEAKVEEFDIATKLKFSGVQVAGFGDRRGTTEGCLEVLFADPARGMYQKIVTSGDAKTLLGGVFVGDTAPFDSLKPLLGRELPAEPNVYLTAAGGGDGIPDTELPDEMCIRDSIHTVDIVSLS